jgi:3-deoxy-D-arabino-heptulosonate 7-phosphate (DAHP) synthase
MIDTTKEQTMETLKTMAPQKTFTLNHVASAYCMELITVHKDAAYFAIPAEFCRPIASGCSCPECIKDPTKATWNVLVAPTKANSAKRGFYNWTYTVHMPNFQEFIDFCARDKK